MGLAVALGMRQARPCYWSQTETSNKEWEEGVEVKDTTKYGLLS